MRIICISGHAQHGKDTAAQFMKEALEACGQKVLVTHYADLLKHICKSFFGWDGEKDESGRTLLQHVGTDVIRKKRPDFWVSFVADILTLFDNVWDYVIISDTRFPNELKYLGKKGFDVIHTRVHRYNFESPLSEEQKKHPSETALDDVEPDEWLFNWSLEQFRDEVYEFIVSMLQKAQMPPVQMLYQMSIFDRPQER